MTKKTIKKLIAGGLAFVCAVTASITAIIMGGLTAHDSDNINHNNQTVLGNFFGNGITLTANADTFENTDLTNYDTTAYAGYNWLGGHTLNAVDGKISVNSSRIILVDYITISELASIEIGDGYALTWLAFDENHTYLGNGTNTYPTLPTGGAWMALGEDLQASTITSWNANAKYMRFGIMTYDGSDVTTFLTNIGVKINTNSAPSTPSAPVAGAQRLTATITPSSATNQKVDWSVSWKNPASTWASGKTVTDYVTVTPTSDGALTADVECKQAFGEQVQVTVTAKDNASISASCSVDYAKRIQKITFVNSADGTGTHTTNDSSFIWNVGFDKYIGPYSSPTYEYSLGTIEDTFDFSIMFYVKNDSAILSDIEAETGYSFTINSYVNGHDIADGFLGMLTVFNLNSASEAEVVALKSYFYNHPQTNIFSMKITATGVHSSFEKTLPIYFDPEALRVDVTNIDLDKSGIVF